MLKQSAFFKKIKRKNLTVNQYWMLYQLYNGATMNSQQLVHLTHQHKVLMTYIQPDGTLNEQGKKLIENMETLFKPQKQLKSADMLGADYEERINEYVELFPKGKLPTGKYARGNKKNIEENFKWFFQEFNYNWDLILKATEMYVEEYRRKNYEFMRTAMYFIKKDVQGTVMSDLATYCEAYLTGDNTPKVVHKRKVV